MASVPGTGNLPPGSDEYIGQHLIAATTVMLVLVTGLLGLRLYARSLTEAQRGWDDHLLIPAYVFFIGLTVTMYLSIAIGGVGYHTKWNKAVDPERVVNWAKIIYALDWFYLPGNTLPRISIATLYLRVLTKKYTRVIAWMIIVYLILYDIGFIISAQFECIPFTYIWDKTVKGGHCFDQSLWYKWSNFPNVFIDTVIMLTPLPTVIGLKAKLSRKIGVGLAFLAGHCGLIASCIRLSVFFTSDPLGDPTWASTSLLIWTEVETGMYLSAACLVGLRPLVASIPKKIHNAKSRVRGYGSASHGHSTKGHPITSHSHTSGTPIRNSITHESFSMEPTSNVDSSDLEAGERALQIADSIYDPVASRDNRQIRVDTKIDVDLSRETQYA